LALLESCLARKARLNKNGRKQLAAYGPRFEAHPAWQVDRVNTYRLDNFSKANLQIIVRNFRAKRTGSVELISAIQSQISNALPERKALHSRYTLTVDVIEDRSFFTMG